MHHHALTVDVADFQVGQLGVPDAGGVEGHQQDAFTRSARCMDELRNFFAAKNRRQAMGLFRVGSIGNAPGPAERLDVKKPQGCQMSPYRSRRFSFPKQLRLIFANVSRA